MFLKKLGVVSLDSCNSNNYGQQKINELTSLYLLRANGEDGRPFPTLDSDVDDGMVSMFNDDVRFIPLTVIESIARQVAQQSAIIQKAMGVAEPALFPMDDINQISKIFEAVQVLDFFAAVMNKIKAISNTKLGKLMIKISSLEGQIKDLDSDTKRLINVLHNKDGKRASTLASIAATTKTLGDTNCYKKYVTSEMISTTELIKKVNVNRITPYTFLASGTPTNVPAILRVVNNVNLKAIINTKQELLLEFQKNLNDDMDKVKAEIVLLTKAKEESKAVKDKEIEEYTASTDKKTTERADIKLEQQVEIMMEAFRESNVKSGLYRPTVLIVLINNFYQAVDAGKKLKFPKFKTGLITKKMGEWEVYITKQKEQMADQTKITIGHSSNMLDSLDVVAGNFFSVSQDFKDSLSATLETEKTKIFSTTMSDIMTSTPA